MFLHVTLRKVLKLEPRFFGPGVEDTLRQRLRMEVEGRCFGRHGYVVTVTMILKIGPGRVEEGTGHAVYDVAYNAIVFKPFRGEILDAVVGTVSELGIFAAAGPLTVYVSKTNMPQGMAFDKAAPVPAFAVEGSDAPISANTSIRVRIIGVRVAAAELSAVGTIAEEGLGVLKLT